MYNCCCIDYDYDPNILTFPEILTARKAHICNECGSTINPGEEYERTRCLEKFDNRNVCWNNHRTCWFCIRIREDFFQCGYTYGMLREDFYQCQGWDYINGPQNDDPVETDN